MMRGKTRPWVALIVMSMTLLLLAYVGVLRHRVIIDGWDVRQEAQLHSVDAAMELFGNEVGSYPSSDANDPTGKAYCGAMKLAEVLMGQDLQGFHSKSAFRQDGLDPTTLAPLYPVNPPADNLEARKGPYLPPESANTFRLADIYGRGNTEPFPEDTYVLCDTFEQKRPSGKKTGMPILYYRANRLGTAHAAGDPNDIFNWQDNQMLVGLGVPGQAGKVHPLSDPTQFYLSTRNDRVQSAVEPFRRDSCILISAGPDGLYGTPDDICNFERMHGKR